MFVKVCSHCCSIEPPDIFTHVFLFLKPFNLASIFLVDHETGRQVTFKRYKKFSLKCLIVTSWPFKFKVLVF